MLLAISVRGLSRSAVMPTRLPTSPTGTAKFLMCPILLDLKPPSMTNTVWKTVPHTNKKEMNVEGLRRKLVMSLVTGDLRLAASGLVLTQLIIRNLEPRD